jgi:CRAL/TRIO domain
MLIINAPAFFSVAWGLIKNFIDPQTAKRIKLVSSKEQGLKELNAIIDADQLPQDYGGKNKSFDQAFREEADDPYLLNQVVELLHVGRRGSTVSTKEFRIKAGESMELRCYTRSVSGGKVIVFNQNEIIKEIDCQSLGEPSCVVLCESISGPANISVEVQDLDNANKKQKSLSRGYFLIVGDARKPGDSMQKSASRRRSMLKTESLMQVSPSSSALGIETISKEPIQYDQLDESERFSSLTKAPIVEMMKRLTMPRICLDSPGYPGCLTKEQQDECQKFLKECPASIYHQIWSLRDVLEPEYIICRWVRATKWDAAAIISRCELNQPLFDEAMKHQFYPDIDKALGAPFTVFMTQYPMLPIGKGKNGCTVNYFRAGQINPEGVMAMTTLAKMEHYFWWGYMHQLKADLRQKISDDPDFVRCEGINVIDLEGLNRAALTSETMDCIKLSSKIGDYFPEVSSEAGVDADCAFCHILSNPHSIVSFDWLSPSTKC